MISVYLNADKSRVLDIPEILIDDTISMIKQKISSKIGVSMDELYLYGVTPVTASPIMIYSLLSSAGKEQITKASLYSFLDNISASKKMISIIKKNINRIEEETPENIYTFEQLKEVFNKPDNAEAEKIRIKKPLGITFSNNPNYKVTNRILLPANPYDAKNISPDYVSYTNNELNLLQYTTVLFEPDMPLVPTIEIYVCSVKEVLSEYVYSTPMELVSLYFPKLTSIPMNPLNIIEDIEKQSRSLEKKSKQLFDSNVKYYSSVDVWNNYKDMEFIAIKYGITSLNFVYKGVEPNIKVPLDYIFKSIHTTRMFSLIRYIASNNREPLVRLFAPVDYSNNEKIPILSKSEVNKILSFFGKSLGLQVFMNYFPQNILCYFILKENGNIEVSMQTKDDTPILPTISLFEVLNNTLNAFIEQINDILKQTDIGITSMEDMTTNIDFKSAEWISIYPIKSTKHLSYSKTKHMANVFYNPNENKKKKDKEKEKTKTNDLHFYFTRISNFNTDVVPTDATVIDINYSVNKHLIYFKVSNIKSIQFVNTIPRYINTFMWMLKEEPIYEDLVRMSATSYTYKTYTGDDILVEKEPEKEEEEEEEELNELDLLILEQLKKQNIEEPQEEEEEAELKGKSVASESDLESILGSLGDLDLSSAEEEEVDELGDLDDDEI